MLLPLIVLLVIPAAEPNEAEKLFREMEAQVNKAKNVECVYEVKVEGDKRSTLRGVKGALLIGEGNKVRMDVDNDFAGKVEKGAGISDGVNGVWIHKEKVARMGTAPQWLSQDLRAGLTRRGIFLSGFALQTAKEGGTDFKLEEQYRINDFKFGKTEKIGQQEAQEIQYALTVKGEDLTLAVNVWLDKKTQLPLRRVFSLMMGDQKITITETFTKLTLDAKIDPKQFELPKK